MSELTITDNAWMATMVASLADNKAALGRRYAEWAVSAPTLESAVAAAAMAQDELGHARSTYPVLKSLGAEAEEKPLGGDRTFAALDREFGTWTEFIAANLVVDGALTVFVRSCKESSLVPMAQRARKILQEEGSHRVHAEAWARRLCRQDADSRAALVGHMEADWLEVSRFLGPPEESGSAEAVVEGLIDVDAATQRHRLADWLLQLFGAVDTTLTLAEPDDWSRWNPERRRLDP